MTKSKKTGNKAGAQPTPTIEGSNERVKQATSRLPLILRVALFAVAAVCVILGIIGIMQTTSVQSSAQSETNASMRAETVRHALVIFSYDESDPSVDLERKGALDILRRSGISSDLVYLNARAAAHNDALADLSVRQVVETARSAGGYDLVIAAGDEALGFVADNQELFEGLPVSFFAVDGAQLAERVQADGIATGYVEGGAVTSSLKEAAKLFPDATQAYILTDGSPEAAGLLAQLKEDPSAAPSLDRTVVDASSMTRDELGEKLSGIDADTSVVLLLAANVDSEGTVYAPSDTAHFLADKTSAPIFSAHGGVGDGVTGAMFVDRMQEGGDAATLAVDLLNGKKAADVDVRTFKPGTVVYDVQALEAHGISPDSVEGAATLVNDTKVSWRTIRPFIRPIVFLIIAGVCALLFGVIGFRRSVKSKQTIIDSRNELEYRLYHDALTDLPNRMSLEKLAADPGNEKDVQSIIQTDIEDFSDINDSYGHAVGNEVLKIVAQRLSGVKCRMLAHLGGDEFMLVFDHKIDNTSSELRHVARIFTDPVIYGGNKIDLSARIGVANRLDGAKAEDLIVFGDLAVRNAKENGIRKPVFYDVSMHEVMERKIQITETLKKAIADESIVVVWQPQVDTQTLEVYGYEALCRLEGNPYYPSDFIPVAEMSGLVLPLDRVMTKKVIEQLGIWLREGRKVGVASINFSAAQLRDKGYCDFLSEELVKNNVPASLIKIEITESMLLGNEDVAEQLFARLRAMGITLALDDFGTGYSSLARLASTPCDFVKLDKSLVDSFMVPGKDDFIDHITQLIHGLDKRIVVEGVETLEQYEICQRLGCDIIQGYFFSRPIPGKEAAEFDASRVVSEARVAIGDKTRNTDWSKYSRDAHGRWQKKDK